MKLAWPVFAVVVMASVVTLGAQKQSPIYSAKPFSLESDAVSRSFAGMDCVKIAAALKQLPLKKSEFETSAAYEQRIAALKARTLYGSIKMSDTVAFTIAPSSAPPVVGFFGGMGWSYDADLGVLSIEWPERTLGRFGAGEELYETVVVTQGATSAYLGQNAFGATAKVWKITNRVCGLTNANSDKDARQNFRWEESWIDSSKSPIKFPMSPSQAQSFIKRPGVLLIGTLASPFYRIGQDFQGPTRDYPLDKKITIDGIVLTLTDVWYYDVTTGHVYYRDHVGK